MELSTNNHILTGQQPLQQTQAFNYGKSLNESLVETFSIKSDKVTISKQYSYSEEITYNSGLTINNLENSGYTDLRDYVAKLLADQGIDPKVNIGDQEVDITQISQVEAQGLVADDGYFGVEATSNRIVDFAIALSGNDPSRIAAIREGVEKGFSEALSAFGGWLPDISYQTIDAVNEKLDSWISQTA